MARGRGRIAAAIAAACVVAAGWAFVRSEDRRLAASQLTSRADPTDAVPEAALLLVEADLAELRASGVAPGILEAGRQVPGLGDVREACGFDPVDTFDRVALAVPEAGEAGDFGVVARLGDGGGRAARVRPEQILACTAKVIAARGGSPVVSTLGRFETVRDVSLATPGGEIAARRDGSLVLLGAGPYLRAMVDAAEGAIPSVGEHRVHARLRAALGEDVTVRASIVLGAAQRAAIAEEVNRAAAAAPPAVARVGAASVGLAFRGERTHVQVVLACDDARAALEVASALEAMRGTGASSALVRMAGLAAVLDGLAIEVERDLVHARIDLARAEAEALVGRLVGGT